jgi:Ca-activated chloride channel family protein
MIKRIFITVIVLLLQISGWAQEVPPALFVKEGEVSKALAVTSVEVKVRIFGSLAETQMTLTFFNPASRAVAGDLYFPLPEGATISGYALDIGGVLVDGVIVEKDRGRQVFEKIVRQGIDPGLVEWVKGNNFKTRVFPIPAQGTRTVMVRYLTDLLDRDEKNYYYLPLNFKGKVKSFSIRVQVVKSSVSPKVEQGGFANFNFSKWEDSFVAETTLKDADLSRDLVIAIPLVNQAPVLVERSADGHVYFAINDSVIPTQIRGTTYLPRKIVIYWDASSSCATADHERAFNLLKAFFSRFQATTMPADLIIFRNSAEKAEQFIIKKGDTNELIGFLKKVSYDGGTQIGSLPPAASGIDVALLFTDGLSNFGKEEPPKFKALLYVFAGQAQANHSFLHYLALLNGGDYFNLTRLSDAAILERIGKRAFSFLDIKIKGGEVAETYPSLAQAVDKRFTLVGILKSKSASITIRYGFNGSVTQEKNFTISEGNAVQGELLRLTWAEKKLAELTIFPERNAEEMVSLGKEHGLVTPGTSLIVLENLNQYVEHRIAPPLSLPEMRKQYFAAIALKDKEQKEKKQSKLEYVVKLWEERVKWWEKKFDYPPDFKYKGPKDKSGEAEGLLPEATENLRDEERMLDVVERPSATTDGEPAKTAEKKENGVDAEAEQPQITIKAWDPDTPYLNALKKVSKTEIYQVYLSFKKEYGGSPAFYLDCGDYFYKQDLPALGLRIWSNIAELELENAALLRILAHRLAQEKELELSALLFKTVLKLRPEEPQSYRDLALVLGEKGEYGEAIDLLYQVVLGEWDRFEEIELIALMELNALIPKAKKAGIKDIKVDPRLVKLLDVDVRIIMTWDADLTDMDLWVTEPSGEKAYYGNRLTTIGANFSRDFTQGYGPEEYILRKTMKGTYKIEANYFSNRAPDISGTVTIQVDVFTNFGRPNQERKSITIRLRENKETISIGEISFK